MKRVSNFFAAASGVFGILPGIAILLSNVGVPPNSSKTLFAATIEALGVLTLMLLWLNKSSIEKISLEKVTKLAIAGIVIFTLSLFCYIFLFGYFIIKVGQSEAVFFPFWAEGELAEAIRRFGTREQLIKEWGRDEIFELIKESSKFSLLITTLLFLFIYQLMFIALTFAFGILGIKSSLITVNEQDH